MTFLKHYPHLFCLLLTIGISHTLCSSQEVQQPCLLKTVIKSRDRLNQDLLQELYLALDEQNRFSIDWFKQHCSQRKKQLSNVLLMLCITRLKLTREQSTSNVMQQTSSIRKSIDHLHCMQKALGKRIAWLEKQKEYLLSVHMNINSVIHVPFE